MGGAEAAQAAVGSNSYLSLTLYCHHHYYAEG